MSVSIASVRKLEADQLCTEVSERGSVLAMRGKETE